MDRVSAISMLVVVVSSREFTGFVVILGNRRSLDAIAPGQPAAEVRHPASLAAERTPVRVYGRTPAVHADRPVHALILSDRPIVRALVPHVLADSDPAICGMLPQAKETRARMECRRVPELPRHADDSIDGRLPVHFTLAKSV
jgi:hypothetical protein